MSKKTGLSYVLDRDTERAYQDFTSDQYVTEKAGYLGHSDFEILENSTGEDGGTLSTRKKVRVDVPGFAKKVMSEVNTVTETQKWGPTQSDGSRSAEVTVEIAGVPARIAGRLSMAADGDATGIDVQLEVKVGIPMIGGKIEGLVVGDLDKTLAGERAFGEKWAAEHP